MSNYDRGVGRIYSVFTKIGVRSKFFQIPKSFASPIKIPVGASGLDWTGLDWTGLDWTGLDWTGLDWTGLDWTGLDCLWFLVTTPFDYFLCISFLKYRIEFKPNLF